MEQEKDNHRGKKVDKELIYRLATMMCTYREIALCVGISERAVSKKYKNLIEKGREEGKKSLRRAQFEKALKGDTKMLTWLGKQYLGQKDSPEDREGTAPLPWED
jgi:predicted transcriptional regulator|tara:strand:+ start:78 stop:392 length:315 start_codon:yes stop_codon:yes gene_type:complete